MAIEVWRAREVMVRAAVTVIILGLIIVLWGAIGDAIAIVAGSVLGLGCLFALWGAADRSNERWW